MICLPPYSTIPIHVGYFVTIITNQPIWSDGKQYHLIMLSVSFGAGEKLDSCPDSAIYYMYETSGKILHL